MIRTVAYTRVSPSAGIGEPSLAEKLELLSEYTKNHDMTIREIIAEQDSGRNICRQSIQDIRHWLWTQEIDCLLVGGEDDLGKDPLLLEMLREEAADCGVSIVIAEGGDV